MKRISKHCSPSSIILIYILFGMFQIVSLSSGYGQEISNKSNLASIAAETSTQEEVSSKEFIVEDEFISTIKHRETHIIYRNLSLFIILMINISFIGYCNFLRKKTKIHWTCIAMFCACSLAIIILLSGMIHTMKFMTYIIFYLGLILVFIEMFHFKRKDNNYHLSTDETNSEMVGRIEQNTILGQICNRIQILVTKSMILKTQKDLISWPDWNRIKSVLFRREYLFVYFVTIIGYFTAIKYQNECGTSDLWTAWFHHYYYIIQNDKWSDSGYHNYASAYTMIVNGISYFYALLLHNSGVEIWWYGHFWFTAMMLMPLFIFVKWNNVALPEVLFFSIGIILYRILFNSLSGLYLGILLSMGGMLFFRIVFSKKRCNLFCNNVILLLGITLSLYLMSCGSYFIMGSLDPVLGCATIGTFFTIFYHIYKIKRIDYRILLYSLPLLVLPLIKPTGVIPAIILSFCFIPYIITIFIVRMIKNKEYKKKNICLLLTLFVILFTPLLSRSMWNFYAQWNNLKYQHSISPGTMLSNAFSQLSDSSRQDRSNEIENWKNLLRTNRPSIIFPAWSSSKSLVEDYLDLLGNAFFSRYPDLDIDETFIKRDKTESHLLTISIIIILLSVLSLFMTRRKLISLYMFFWTLFTFIIFYFNQIYLTPMFTDVPPLFRYLYPSYTLLFGLCFFNIFSIFDNRRVFCGSLLTTLILASLYPHFYSKTDFPVKPSSIGDVMLAEINSTEISAILLSNTWSKGRIQRFLYDSKLIPKRTHNYSLPETISDTDLVFKDFAISTFEPSPQKPGLYFTAKVNNVQEFYPFLCNKDASSLLNKVYYLSDPNSWNDPPWLEIDLYDNKCKKWLISKNDTLYINEFRNGVVRVSQPPRKYTLISLPYYCFSNDIIRFTGKHSDNLQFSIVLVLYEKRDGDGRFKWLKRVPFNMKVINPHNNEFQAEVNLADIKIKKLNTYYRVAFDFEPGAEGELYDYHLYQYVSGKLNLKQVLTELKDSKRIQQSEINVNDGGE